MFPNDRTKTGTLVSKINTTKTDQISKIMCTQPSYQQSSLQDDAFCSQVRYRGVYSNESAAFHTKLFLEWDFAEQQN